MRAHIEGVHGKGCRGGGQSGLVEITYKAGKQFQPASPCQRFPREATSTGASSDQLHQPSRNNAIISSVTVVLALRVNFGVPPDTTLQILSINKEARGRATPIVNFSLIRNPSERGRKIRQYKFHSLCKRKGFGQTLYHLYVSLQLHPGGKGETRKIVLKDSH